MKFKDFYSMVERNSNSGDILEFIDKTDPNGFWTDPELTYETVPYIGSDDMTIALRPSNGIDGLDRDTFLNFLDSLQCRPKLKCQLAIYREDGDWRGYLTDNLWSHMEIGEVSGMFYLDNPWDPSGESYNGIRFDPVSGAINGGG